MLKISEEDIDFLRSQNIEDLENLLNEETPRNLLIELDDKILEKGFDGEFYNAFGKKAQKVYDRILHNN